MQTVRSSPVRGLLAGLVLQLVLLVALTDTVGLGSAGWLAGVTCGVVTVVALRRGLARSGAAVVGTANSITLVRATCVGAMTALIADSFVRFTSVAAVLALAGVALLLDAVDGRVARRTGTVTVVGARFDMEVDAFLIFVLSCYVAAAVGAWVLLIGLARYLFVVAGRLWPWLREPAPSRPWCKVVAAVQGVVLTVAAAGVLPDLATAAALAGALMLLAESFSRQAWWLARHRPYLRALPVTARQLAAAGSPAV